MLCALDVSVDIVVIDVPECMSEEDSVGENIAGVPVPPSGDTAHNPSFARSLLDRLRIDAVWGINGGEEGRRRRCFLSGEHP